MCGLMGAIMQSETPVSIFKATQMALCLRDGVWSDSGRSKKGREVGLRCHR